MPVRARVWLVCETSRSSGAGMTVTTVVTGQAAVHKAQTLLRGRGSRRITEAPERHVPHRGDSGPSARAVFLQRRAFLHRMQHGTDRSSGLAGARAKGLEFGGTDKLPAKHRK